MTIAETGNRTHIEIRETPNPNKVTRIWVVRSRYNCALLGEIKWFGRWRKYAFFPQEDCVFEEVCMRELSEFIETKTKEHKSR